MVASLSRHRAHLRIQRCPELVRGNVSAALGTILLPLRNARLALRALGSIAAEAALREIKK
jgi:hypothetical protein